MRSPWNLKADATEKRADDEIKIAADHSRAEKNSLFSREKLGADSGKQVTGAEPLRAYNLSHTTTKGQAIMNTTPATNPGSPAVAAAQSVLTAVLNPLFSMATALEHWRRRQQLSMQLAHVDARTLRDAGISEAQRFIGVNKPF
jgi:uncharacterized protein YjiS (DUF1127 family)